MLEEQIKEPKAGRKSRAAWIPRQPRSAQLAAANRDRNLKSDANRLKERIEYYQQRVENTPKREQELVRSRGTIPSPSRTIRGCSDRFYEAASRDGEAAGRAVQDRGLRPARGSGQPQQVQDRPIFLVLGPGSGRGSFFSRNSWIPPSRGLQLESWSDGIPCTRPSLWRYPGGQAAEIQLVFSIGVNVFIIIVGIIIGLFTHQPY